MCNLFFYPRKDDMETDKLLLLFTKVFHHALNKFSTFMYKF